MLTEPSSVQAVKYIEYDTSFAEEEKKQAKALKVVCNLNDAASKLKLKEYKQAEKLCTKVSNFDLRNFCEVLFCAWFLCLPMGCLCIQVLELEGRNVKALYRRAQAYIQLADLDLAELDIKKALEIDPNNRYMLVCDYLSGSSTSRN